MKIRGFLEDLSGIKKITKARQDAMENASAELPGRDPIREIADTWHPGELELRVLSVKDAGKEAKSYRFGKADGSALPPFLAGQYLVLTLDIDGKAISRPYSISSAPSDAFKENGFVEITVKKPREDGFFADRLFENLKEGGTVKALIGCGQFYYESLRDAQHILALAGGVGITPFASMAREIAAGGLEGLSLTILYGANSKEELILFDELREAAAACPERIRIVPVTDGFLSAERIAQYLSGDTSVFICGPQAMYRYLREELPKLALPQRRVRFEVFGQVKDISAYPGYPAEAVGKTYNLTVHRGIREDVVPAKASESLAVALERAGIRLETGCRSGECGFCRTKVLSGPCFICPENDGRRAADKEFDYVHACAAFPLGDLEIRIPIA